MLISFSLYRIRRHRGHSATREPSDSADAARILRSVKFHLLRCPREIECAVDNAAGWCRLASLTVSPVPPYGNAIAIVAVTRQPSPFVRDSCDRSARR